MSQVATKRERLEARVSPEQKALLVQAAQLQGRSLTDFVVAAAQAAAEETLRARQIMLTTRDSALLMEALLTPPPPNEQLRAAFARHPAS
jgi:uncharacterized protein (DUF1778 family)